MLVSQLINLTISKEEEQAKQKALKQIHRLQMVKI
jgi:hypothetical protein